MFKICVNAYTGHQDAPLQLVAIVIDIPYMLYDLDQQGCWTDLFFIYSHFIFVHQLLTL